MDTNPMNNHWDLNKIRGVNQIPKTKLQEPSPTSPSRRQWRSTTSAAAVDAAYADFADWDFAVEDDASAGQRQSPEGQSSPPFSKSVLIRCIAIVVTITNKISSHSTTWRRSIKMRFVFVVTSQGTHWQRDPPGRPILCPTTSSTVSATSTAKMMKTITNR